MKNLSGKFEIKTGLWHPDSTDVISSHAGEINIEVIGCCIPMSADDDLSALYQKHNLEITKYLRGNYILAVYDNSLSRLCIFQDRMTSPVTLYYTLSNDTLFYSTSLKKLLNSSQIMREMNDDAIEEFLVNGYLYGEHTLLKNVKKLKAGHALVVERNGVRQVSVNYPNATISPGEALQNWDSILSDAVLECAEDENEIDIPISSGYDSSYILNTLHKAGKAIHAFSIGGKFGKNELPQVQENMKQYPLVELHTALTSTDTLQNFPDIVWRLEGAVYEVGVFLQYELAKLVSSFNCHKLICGECADQIMNMHFADAERMEIKPSGTYYAFDEYPYIFGSHLILKKNGILFNSFGIKTRYPYCDERFITIANALAEYNGKDKRCHVANCKKLLPAPVLTNISKIGGATEFHSLFENDAERCKLLELIKKSSFYQRHQEIIKKHSYIESALPHGITKVKTDIRNAILGLLHVGSESRRKNKYFLEEMELRDALCVLYLILFEKLFISSTINLTQETCSTSLNEILQ